MIDRRAKLIGLQLIEAALQKVAEGEIYNPSVATLKAMKSKQLGTPIGTANAAIPKVLTLPST